MAISTSRTPRNTGEFIVPKQSTSPYVAAGTYSQSAGGAPQRGEASVPFSSMQDRVLNPNTTTSGITPGPGAYIGQDARSARTDPSFGEAISVGPISFKSKAARLAPTAPGSSIFKASTIEKNPGPGAYESGSGWEPQRPKEAVAALRPVVEARERTASSIPSSRLMPGEEPQLHSGGDINYAHARHRGDHTDMVGPGEYEPLDTLNKIGRIGLNLGGSKLDRKLWEPTVAIDSKLPDRANPGPGSYDAKGPYFSEQAAKNVASGNTNQFSSQTPMAYQSQVTEEKQLPGPGQYDVRGDIERSARQARSRGEQQGDRLRFDSTSERVGWNRPLHQPFKDPYHVRNVPGPGHYPDPASTWPSPRKRDPTESDVLNSGKNKLTGVHHPTIVMALKDVQAPLQAFNSTDDRPCNKPLEQATPAPWQYDVDRFRGCSMGSKMREREKVGRKGIFGTCSDRFYGSPITPRKGLAGGASEIGMNPTDAASGAPVTTSMFQSSTSRMARSIGPREVHTKAVGQTETPAPGAYETTTEPSYLSPYRTRRQDHVSFGSGKTRFGKGEDKDFVRPSGMVSTDPGQYEPNMDTVTKRVQGGAKLNAYRKPPIVGCTTENVGPGSYGASVMETSLVRKSHNVSTAQAHQPRSARGVREAPARG